jgi:multidrug resistance efflux pump
MKAKRRQLVLAVLLVVAAAVAALGLIHRRADKTQVIPGMVRQTEIRIAPEISGRLKTIAVRPGQNVRKGELLAALGNPELEASLGEAKAAAASARADRAKIYSGVRPEEVAIAEQAVRTAEANRLLAQQQETRTVALAAKDFASAQQHDESVAALAKAGADLDLKRAQFEAASAGPVAEERALADAKVALAEANIADLQASLEKLNLVAPVDGMVGIQVAEPGEIIAPGKPVMTIEVAGQTWFAFTLREDALNGLRVGMSAPVSAADGRQIEARVTELRPLGEFATWRAARAVGDHDLNSFRLRLDPPDADEKLEPGMSVWLSR